jgi:hypothetical protein
MNTEDKILALLEHMQEEQKLMRDDISGVKDDLAGVKDDLAGTPKNSATLFILQMLGGFLSQREIQPLPMPVIFSSAKMEISCSLQSRRMLSVIMRFTSFRRLTPLCLCAKMGENRSKIILRRKSYAREWNNRVGIISEKRNGKNAERHTKYVCITFTRL